jgi:hypothetical protein
MAALCLHRDVATAAPTTTSACSRRETTVERRLAARDAAANDQHHKGTACGTTGTDLGRGAQERRDSYKRIRPEHEPPRGGPCR